MPKQKKTTYWLSRDKAVDSGYEMWIDKPYLKGSMYLCKDKNSISWFCERKFVCYMPALKLRRGQCKQVEVTVSGDGKSVRHRFVERMKGKQAIHEFG